MTTPQNATWPNNAVDATKPTAKDSSVPISLDTVAAAGFNTKNPIMHAVIDTIVRNSKPKMKKDVTPKYIRCNICDCEMSSDVVYQAHLVGAKHNKKLKAKQILNDLKAKGDACVKLNMTLDDEDPNAYRCEICQVSMNSPQQLELHVAGNKHKKKLAKQGATLVAAGSTTEEPPAKKKKAKDDGVTQKAFRCDLCCIVVNSQLQIDQHMTSKKHQNKLKGPFTGRPRMGAPRSRNGGDRNFDDNPGEYPRKRPFNQHRNGNSNQGNNGFPNHYRHNMHQYGGNVMFNNPSGFPHQPLMRPPPPPPNPMC